MVLVAGQTESASVYSLSLFSPIAPSVCVCVCVDDGWPLAGHSPPKVVLHSTIAFSLYPPFYLKISFFIFFSLFLSSHISRDVHKTEQKEKQLLRLWPAYLSLHVREKDSSIFSLFVVVVVYSLSLSPGRYL